MSEDQSKLVIDETLIGKPLRYLCTVPLDPKLWKVHFVTFGNTVAIGSDLKVQLITANNRAILHLSSSGSVASRAACRP